MKKVNFLLLVMALMLCTTVANAQEKVGDFFIGKWTIVVTGTPNGDATMNAEFKRNDDGQVVGSIGTDTFTRLEVKENSITAYWTAGGYDVYIFLEKIDDNNCEGTMMDMFDATAKRDTASKN